MSDSVREFVLKKTEEAVLATKRDQTPITISGDERLRELELDSLKIIELIFDLETAFEFELDEGELARVETVNDLVDLVHANHNDVKQG